MRRLFEDSGPAVFFYTCVFLTESEKTFLFFMKPIVMPQKKSYNYLKTGISKEVKNSGYHDCTCQGKTGTGTLDA